MKILLIVSLLLVVGFCAQAQQTKQPPKAAVAPYTIPEEAVHQANPVKATPESIAHGKKWYGYDCAMCHGKDGDGKGERGSGHEVESKRLHRSHDPEGKDRRRALLHHQGWKRRHATRRRSREN